MTAAGTASPTTRLSAPTSSCRSRDTGSAARAGAAMGSRAGSSEASSAGSWARSKRPRRPWLRRRRWKTRPLSGKERTRRPRPGRARSGLRGPRRRRSCARISPRRPSGSPTSSRARTGRRPSSSRCPTASRAGASSSTASPATSWAATLEAEAKSVKDLMVRPYLPRFFREGDQAELRVMVNNAGEKDAAGEVTLEITDPVTGENLAPAFGLPASVPPRAFTVKPGGGSAVAFALRAPARVGTVAFKVVARSGALSDGELRPLPVLPGRMHLVQSRFATLKEGKARELRFDDMAKTDDPTRINEQLVVTVDAQLFYGLLEALPYLVNYPYECTEQTLNRFLSTGILTSLYDKYPQVARMAQELSKRETVYETFDAADPNRKMALEETPWLETAQGGKDAGLGVEKVLDPRVAKAQRETSLAKLLKAQTSLGAFPWWPGGPPSPYMTLYIVQRLQQGARVRRRGAQGAGGEGVRLPPQALPRRDRLDAHGPRYGLGVRHVPQLHAEQLSRRVVDGRRLHRRGAEADARLLVQALEGPRSLSQGLSGAYAQAGGAGEGRVARLGERHGQRQDDRRRRDELGARRTAAGSGTTTRSRPTPSRCGRSWSSRRRTSGARGSSSGSSSTRSSTTGSRRGPRPRSSTRWPIS